MDRPLNEFLPFFRTPPRFPTLTCGLALALLLGCGGGGDKSADSERGGAPAGVNDAVPPPGTPNPNNDPPAKILTEGLTLPDDVDLPATAPAPDNDRPKGMHLPDDLQPSASAPFANGTQVVQLVSSSAQCTQPEGFQTDIQYASWTEIDAKIRKTDKVTVVDLWSLACTPCLREYPHLVALQKQYPQRVQAIGVNLDYDGRKNYPPQSYEARAQEFLAAVKAGFPNYLSETPSEEVLAALEIGSLPSVLVFDEAGKLAGRFTVTADAGTFSYQQDIAPLVAKLLAK